MTRFGKLLSAGLLMLTLTVPLQAQVPYYGWNQGQVFAANPFLQQAALNQAAARNIAAAQLGLAGLQGGGAITSLPTSPIVGYAPTVYPNATQPVFGAPTSDGAYFPPPGYPLYSFESPIGAFYRGIADMTIAYGRYAQDYQKARLLNQDVERAKMVTRRMYLEEMQYLRTLAPSYDEQKRQERERDLYRARKSPGLGEIVNAAAINTLLDELKVLHGKGRRGPTVTLDQELMKNVNVAPKKGRNVALIKNSKINWSQGLRDEAFTALREKIDLNLKDIIDQARFGKIDDAKLKLLRETTKALDELLDKKGPTLSVSDYIEGKRCLGSLTDSVSALSEQDAQNFFNNEYAARGSTVSDLVEYMTRKGLIFASAVPGEEAAYRAAYSWLLAYYEGISER